jgi:hypothetical protein
LAQPQRSRLKPENVVPVATTKQDQPQSGWRRSANRNQLFGPGVLLGFTFGTFFLDLGMRPCPPPQFRPH